MSRMVASAVERRAAGRAFTRNDLDRMPDDGHWYELIDGALIVTPAPGLSHQTVVTNLAALLVPLCPPSLKLLVAPFDVDPAEDTRLQPDVLVAPRANFEGQRLEGAPALVVEVLSPSTRHLDRGLKRARYETAGCRSCWIIDPLEPSAVAYELEGDTYREVGRAVGDEPLTRPLPFPVTSRPADLAF